jgi:exonuclease SbcD
MNRIIHTSDWHLGQRLERQDRGPEQEAFLHWLLAELAGQEVDALLVCGDIFDVANPPIDAVRLLYAFLAQARRHCPNVLLLGGNHDSGPRLDAMAPLAEALGITVLGSLPDQVARTVVTLCDRGGAPFATVAAVPYLRPGDLNAAQADEDVGAQHHRVLESMRQVYARVLSAVPPDAAKPLIVTGHLFARGGIVTEGERATHVEAGKLLAVTPDIFGDRADYVALGHLHRAQTVCKHPPVHYCGTPVPLSFGEADQEQQVLRVDIEQGRVVGVTGVPVPRTVALHDLRGAREAVLARLKELRGGHPKGGLRGWLRVTVVEARPDPGFRDEVLQAVADTELQVLAVRREGLGDHGGLADALPRQRLDEMTPEAVFELLHRCQHGGPPEPSLVDAFATLLQAVRTGETVP